MNSSKKPISLWLEHLLENYGLWVSFVLLFLILSIASPYFLTLDNIFNVLRQISVTAILAFGMTFVITTAQIDLSIGAVVALTGVTAAALLKRPDLPSGIWILAVLIEGFLIGLIWAVAKQKMPAFFLL